MAFSPELARVIELFQFPFMQRALLGGVLTGTMGGLLGSLTILRELSFFSDALGHSVLLGISLGVLLGIDPGTVILPSAIFFALVVAYLLEKTRLWTDALLNIVYSSSLAAAIVILGLVKRYQGGLESLLFGDILSIRNTDLVASGVLLAACLIFVSFTLSTQMLLTLNESMAVARGVSAPAHRRAFIVLLSLVVGSSIPAIGTLLVSAFIVIPACAARLIGRGFNSYIILAAAIGASSAIIGMLLSAHFNLPSGPSIVLTQSGIFLGAIAFHSLFSVSPKPELGKWSGKSSL